MQVLEKITERKFVNRVRSLGCIVLKFTPDGEAGWPDRLVLLPGGRSMFVEFKAKGSILRKLQQHRFTQLTKLGHRACWFDDADDAYNHIAHELRVIQGLGK